VFVLSVHVDPRTQAWIVEGKSTVVPISSANIAGYAIKMAHVHVLCFGKALIALRYCDTLMRELLIINCWLISCCTGASN
jgi:hypothetical protein